MSGPPSRRVPTPRNTHRLGSRGLPARRNSHPGSGTGLLLSDRGARVCRVRVHLTERLSLTCLRRGQRSTLSACPNGCHSSLRTTGDTPRSSTGSCGRCPTGAAGRPLPGWRAAHAPLATSSPEPLRAAGGSPPENVTARRSSRSGVARQRSAPAKLAHIAAGVRAPTNPGPITLRGTGVLTLRNPNLPITRCWLPLMPGAGGSAQIVRWVA
jgi:hypothetical protein